MRTIGAFVISVLLFDVPAAASETVTYSYDAKGRLIQVVHSGTVNNGTTTTYTNDRADNRARVTVTGAPH